MYFFGKGVAQDTVKGITYFDKSHQLDQPLASEALARIYLYGLEGVAVDIEKAKPYLMHGVEEGLPISRFLLAYMYLNGIGYPKDEVTGLEMLLVLTKEDFPKAQIEVEKLETLHKMPLPDYIQTLKTKTEKWTRSLKLESTFSS